jgi:hypothetical protein
MAAPPPLTKTQQILAARYAPLILPNLVSVMPTGEYQKYIPKFTGEGDVSVLAIFLVRGDRTQKNGSKPTCPKFCAQMHLS